MTGRKVKGPKTSIKGRKQSPLRWLKDASPEEIGEALLSVGVDKAAEVVVYLAQRAGPEIGDALDRAMEQVQRDPARALARAGMGALNSLLGR